MVSITSNTRLSRLSEKVILTQTDTTVGFLSQNAIKLQNIKERMSTKPFIKVFKNLKNLTANQQRIPQAFKNTIRRSKKTTYIIKNISFRVVNNSLNSQLLTNQTWNYSTSANEKGKKFNREFCENKTDIIIENINGFKELPPSSLYRLNKIKKEKIR